MPGKEQKGRCCTNFGQSDQKECQGKGGVSFSARRQILGYESPLLAQGLRVLVTDKDRPPHRAEAEDPEDCGCLSQATHSLV